MKQAFRTYIANGLKGLFIGIANTIPGVSGGTIAVITGVYEPLIEFFASLSASVSFRSHISRKGEQRKPVWAQLRAQIQAIAPLLLPLVLGALCGILLFANVIEIMFERIPSQTQFLFIGLILGSLPFLAKQSSKVRFRPVYLIPFAVCTALLIVMALQALPESSTLISAQNIIRELSPLNIAILIGGGMLSVGAMIVPGLSGSFVMVLIGLYGTFRTMVVELNFGVIFCFLVGACAGLFLVSRVISLLLKKFYGATYFGILGLVVGSLAFLWPGLRADVSGITSVCSMIGGFLLAYSLSAERRTAQTPALESRSQKSAQDSAQEANISTLAKTSTQKPAGEE